MLPSSPGVSAPHGQQATQVARHVEPAGVRQRTSPCDRITVPGDVIERFGSIEPNVLLAI
jgi:hypothetical protein